MKSEEIKVGMKVLFKSAAYEDKERVGTVTELGLLYVEVEAPCVQGVVYLHDYEILCEYRETIEKATEKATEKTLKEADFASLRVDFVPGGDGHTQCQIEYVQDGKTQVLVLSVHRAAGLCEHLRERLDGFVGRK